MIWASLAAANKRDPPISSVVLLVLAAGAVPGTAFYPRFAPDNGTAGTGTDAPL